MTQIFKRKVIFILFAALISFVANAQTQFGGLPLSIQNQKIHWLPEVKTMPEVNAQSMMAEDEINNATKDVPFRFGKNFDVDYTLENSGKWHKLSNGDRVWLLAIESPGAMSINLFFDEWYMPPGSSFYVYNEGGTQVFGAYNELNNLADGTFATYPCRGEKIYIEYYEPFDYAYVGKVNLSVITHAYRDIDEIAKGIGDSGSCNNDVVCPVSAGWSNEIRSVAMIVVSGNGICSGALINNTANDGFPYFLTANHCIGGSVASWVIRFNFQATTCGGSTSQTYQTAVGTTLLANGAASDYALLQINGGVDIPNSWNPYYAGWDSSTATPTSSCGIHHPSGDLKKISFENDASQITGYGGGVGSGTNHVRVVDWDSGTTEGGSSGSPLFNSNHRIVGQLHGGGAACGNNASDWYGRFFTSFPSLCAWLAPSQCGLTGLAGYDPLLSGFTLDAQISSISSPTGTICGNTISPQLIFGNAGSSTLTSASINYNIDGGANSTFNWVGSLATGASISVNLPNVVVTNGAHTFNATASSPNGGVDQNNANNTGSSPFTAITNGSVVTLSITTDCWGEEVSWNIENSSNVILYSQAANTLGDLATINSNFCLTDGCYDFNIFDSFGDGLDGTASGCATDGTYSMTGTGGTLFTMGNSNYGAGTTHNFCLNTSGVPGCTNPLACNYNPAATLDNGTCVIPATNDQCVNSQNIVVNGGSVAGSNVNTCVNGPLPTCGGTTMIKDVWYSFTYTGGTITITTTLGTLTDTRIAVYGSCGGTSIACNDDISGANFASTLSLTCGQLTAGNTYYIQVGGFQALAGTFGITVTSSAILGCTNPIASNYNACATQNDGTCIIPGCTDLLACNYNPVATQNNGTCVYPGCINPSACNYNAAAGCDNGSCTLPGCIDPNACNFNASAGCDNGSCDYSCLGNCPGDFNGDLTVGISDLLSFLSGYGCTSGCAPYDLTGDDLVGASDLLVFLSYYGTTCN